jgi:OPT family oligopeptide transporter
MQSGPPDSAINQEFRGLTSPAIEEHDERQQARESLTSGLRAAALSANGLLDHKTSAGHQGYDRESFASMNKSSMYRRDVESSVTGNALFDHVKDEPYTHDLTWRSLIVGAALGIIFGTQNVYFGIRSGSSFGGSITVSLVGYGIMRLLTKFIANSLPFNAHENVILQTTAATGQAMIFTGGFSTYILGMSSYVADPNELKQDVTYNVSYWQGLVWLLSVICLGFFMAQPMRQQLIVKNDYPWPSPTATAVVIQSLHKAGAQEFAMKMLKFLINVTVVSFLWYWFKWLFNATGEMQAWPKIGAAAASFTWTVDWSTAYIGSGVLMPWKSAWSMLAGAIVMFGIVSPVVWQFHDEWFPNGTKYNMSGLKAYWFLSSLAITIVDSIYQIIKIAIEYVIDKRRKRLEAAKTTETFATSTFIEAEKEEDPATLVPTWLWLGGFIVNTILVCITTPLLFGVAWYKCLVCVLIGPIIGYGVNLGAALTDVGLVSAIGKFIIICFGSWAGDIITALWMAGLGMAAVGSSNDLLADYRTA